MMDTTGIDIERGVPEDAEVISALAIQVFLDTYASEGVRADLAVEAFSEYSKDQFDRRLGEPDRIFLFAKRGDGMVGFAEFNVSASPLPGQDEYGAELVRLYVQPKSQGLGIGKKLLRKVEEMVLAHGGRLLWLTVWEKNESALDFYRTNGYRGAGTLQYELQGNTYGNEVLYKTFAPAAGID